MISMLLLNTFILSTLLILSPGPSLKGSKKTVQEQKFPTDAQACKENSSQKACPSSIFPLQDVLKLQQESLKQVEDVKQGQEFQCFQEQASQGIHACP